MKHSPLNELRAVLTRERTALLGGTYDDLPDLAEKKGQLLDALARSSPDRSDLRRIKRKMDQNQDLIAAALRGVGAAKERISALEAVRNGLMTYDQSGQVALVTKPTQSFEKKA